MPSVDTGLFVGLPQVELSTAGTIASPSLRGGLTVNKRRSTALSITVPSSVLGTGLVRRVFRASTIRLHLDQVNGPVHAALEGGDIDIKRELSIGQLEQLVLVLALQEIGPRADVITSHVVQPHPALHLQHTVRALVAFGTINTLVPTVFCTGCGVRAIPAVPSPCGAATVVVSDIVQPPP